VIPLRNIFKPYLVRYILETEPKLQEWCQKFIEKEATLDSNTTTSAYDLFKCIAYSEKILGRFQLNKSEFADEYILFTEMVGRVLQYYIDHLIKTENFMKTVINLKNVKHQFKQLCIRLYGPDLRVNELCKDILIAIERRWPVITNKIIRSMEVEMFIGPAFESFDLLISHLNDILDTWSKLMGYRKFMSFLLNIFDHIMQEIERFLVPSNNLKLHRWQRPIVAKNIKMTMPMLLAFFHENGDGPCMQILQEHSARLCMIIDLFEIEIGGLIAMMEHPSDLSEIQVISIIMSRGKKIVINTPKRKVVPWRKIVTSRRCKQYNL